MDIGPGELAIILVLLVLLFGGAKIPKLARSLGQAKHEFEAGMRESSGASGTGTEPDGPRPGSPTDA
jgi:sec-independent protein translocase protein TatA